MSDNISDMMNIPKTLRVGFQTRRDTYTGKLAYVIYIDEKGKLRKEASWSSWRDQKIDSIDYPNEPTSGFVLNKKVGDYKSDWNHRSAAIRIYDPRGFEFEISVENLLFILQECSSIKGKGLEGEFVYAWDKSDLVLLPITSQEYKISREFTDMKTMKVKKSDMVEGCVYLNKNMEKMLYLGQHDIYEMVREEESSPVQQDTTHWYNKPPRIVKTTSYFKNKCKRHVFKQISDNTTNEIHDDYWFQDGFTKLASKVSDDIHTSFPEEYDTFKKSLHASCADKFVIKPYDINEKIASNKEWYSLTPFALIDGKYYKLYITVRRNGCTIIDDISLNISHTTNECQFSDNKIIQYYNSTSANRHDEILKLKELKKYELYDVQLVNSHGSSYDLVAKHY